MATPTSAERLAAAYPHLGGFVYGERTTPVGPRWGWWGFTADGGRVFLGNGIRAALAMAPGRTR